MNTIQCCTRLGLLTAGTALLGLPASAAPTFNMPSLRDMQVTIFARRALSAYPTLAKLNLTVTVRDGVATVWGPVPNGQIGKQAVKQLEMVKGIYQVKSDLFIFESTREDLAGVPFVFAAPTRSQSASPDRDSGQISNLAGPLNLRAAAPVAPSLLPAAVALLPPVAVPESRGAAVSTVSASKSISELVVRGIDRLRQADQRFRAIGVEVRDGAVTLRSGTALGEHVMAFAQAIARLPGVERVVVQNGVP